MIQAIIFDFDGLIIDTEMAWFDAYAEIYRQRGATLPLDKYVQIVGAVEGWSFDPYVYLAECTGQPVDKKEIENIAAQQVTLMLADKRPRPGVIDYLETAKQMGLKIGLASSSTREWVLKYLEQCNLTGYFECIRTSNDVKKTKPDPELYLSALAALGVPAANAMAFEDSANGALAAKRAGLRCVIVPNDLTKHCTFGEYDLRLDSMADMPLPDVIGKLAQKEEGRG